MPRRNAGLILFRCDDMNDLVPAVHTGSRRCPCAPSLRWSNRLRAFWPEPVSIFGSTEVDGACGSSFCLDLSFSLTLRPPLMLAVAETTSQPSRRPLGRRYVVAAAFDPTVTSRADAARLVRTEPHVFLSASLHTAKQSSQQLQFALRHLPLAQLEATTADANVARNLRNYCVTNLTPLNTLQHPDSA
jgi:hypothetical protein